MSESDVLQRAAAALRAAHDGQREGSGFTRARVLATLAQRRRPRRWHWLVATPFATLLLVGSAWAQSTGNWARVWHAVATVLPFVQPSASTPERTPERTPEKAPARAPRSTVVPETTPSEATPPEPPDLGAPAALQAKPPALPAHKPARPAATRPPPELPADPELSAFRAAHELHVQGDQRAAIDAYADYLRAYPQGRFVPEARYNTALDQIKLGDIQAARKALEPFARGAYDGYRQREARQLLEALPH